MTPDQLAKLRALAAAGCSARGIAGELGASRRQVDKALAELAAEQAEPATEAEPGPVAGLLEIPEVPALEVPAPPRPAAPPAAPPDPDPEPTPTEQRKAKLEAEAARDNLRGLRELRQEGVSFSNSDGRHCLPHTPDPALAAIEARRWERDRVRTSFPDPRGLGRYRGTI